MEIPGQVVHTHTNTQTHTIQHGQLLLLRLLRTIIIAICILASAAPSFSQKVNVHIYATCTITMPISINSNSNNSLGFWLCQSCRKFWQAAAWCSAQNLKHKQANKMSHKSSNIHTWKIASNASCLRRHWHWWQSYSKPVNCQFYTFFSTKQLWKSSENRLICRQTISNGR